MSRATFGPAPGQSSRQARHVNDAEFAFELTGYQSCTLPMCSVHSFGKGERLAFRLQSDAKTEAHAVFIFTSRCRPSSWYLEVTTFLARA